MHTLISESFITEIPSPSKNTSGLAYSFNDLKEWSSQSIHSNDDWIVLGLTTPEGEKKNICTIPISKSSGRRNPCN